jgi:protein transport protein SEC20
MTAQELQTRLKSHFEALRETSVLISRLSKLSVQSGRNSPHSSEETESRVELSAGIHQSLKEQEEEYELIRQEVEDFTSGGTWGSGARRRDSEKDQDRITLVTQVERLDEDLKL